MDLDARRALLKKFIPALLIAFALLFSPGCGNPGYPPELSPEQAEDAFMKIRAVLTGKSGDIPDLKAQGYVVSLYDGNGKRKAAGGINLTDCLNLISNNYNSEKINTSYITLSILRKFSKIKIKTLSKYGLSYEKGLHGVALAKDNKVKIYESTLIAARDLDFSSVVEKLEGGRGITIKGLKLGDGLYLVEEEAFTEPEPGAPPLPLFRANVLFDQASSDLIRQSIRWGGDQLLAIQRKNGSYRGSFYYEYNPGPDKVNKRTYNLLRHAGTCYSLFSLYGETKDERYLESARLGMEWLLRQMRTPDWDPDRTYPVYGNKGRKKQAKLGGAALSLLALCEQVKYDPDYDVSPVMHKLANHLIKMQKKDGSFASYYSWNKKPVKKRFSIYYPGESILALIRFYNLAPERKDALETVLKGSDFLIDKRWQIAGIEVNVPPDAWLTIALSEIWKVQPEEKYAKYCLRLADTLSSDQIVKLAYHPDYYGGYFPFPPQVTPAGARMEGLTAAYYLAKDSGRDTAWILDTIKRGTTFQILMQIRPEFDHLFKDPERALGTFRHSPVSSENRIDYNQHNISGLIVAAQILDENR